MRKTFLNLNTILDISNYKMSLTRWLKDSSSLKQYMDKYIPIIKPMVHRYNQGRSISILVLSKINPFQYSFFTNEL